MAKPKLRLVPPATENGTVGQRPPRRPKNEDLREREHLRPEEIEKLIEAARGNRHGTRDALMVLMAYRHGLRASGGRPPEMGAGRLRSGRDSRQPAQRRHACDASLERPGIARASQAQARQPAIALCLRVRTRVRPSRRPGSIAWSNAPPSPPSSGSRCTPTCCATPAASNWPTTGSIPGRSRPTSGTAISRIRPATRRCRRGGLRISGGTNHPARQPPGCRRTGSPIGLASASQSA